LILCVGGLADARSARAHEEIPASVIARIRHLPQKIGWRYQPHAHGKRPCGCPACLPRGSIKSKKIRERYEPESKPVSYETLTRRLTESSDLDTLIESLWSLATSCAKRIRRLRNGSWPSMISLAGTLGPHAGPLQARKFKAHAAGTIQTRIRGCERSRGGKSLSTVSAGRGGSRICSGTR
jgi:hypothetical protein